MERSKLANRLPENGAARETSAKIPVLPLLASLVGLEAALVAGFMTTGLFLFNVLEGWLALIIGCLVLAIILKQFKRRIIQHS